MARQPSKVVPVSLAVLLHIVLFGSMFVSFEYVRPAPITPMIVTANLVEDVPTTVTRPQPEPEPEPEPEPVVELPEPEPEPEPDNSEELRRQAEAEKLRQDRLLEEKRLEEQRQREAEEQRQREREEAERKQREEEEKERRREEAERKRQEDIQRQREENERRRRELEAEERANEIAAEEARETRLNSSEMQVYMMMIQQKVIRHWSVPPSMGEDDVCVAKVRQARDGQVISVTIMDCDSGDAAERSIEAAFIRASPLPQPSSPDLFEPEITFNMKPPLD